MTIGDRPSMKLKLESVGHYYAGYGFLAFAFGLVGVFLNLYFFTAGSYTEVLLYQILVAGGIAFGFTLSGYLYGKHSAKHVFMFGGIGRAALLLMLMVFSGILSNFLLFGLLYGIAGGFLWSGNNVLNYDVLRGKNRVRILSNGNIAINIISLVAPFIGGVLVQFSSLSGTMKFSFDLISAAAFFFIAALIMGRLRLEEKPFKYSLKNTALNGSRYTKFKLFYGLKELFLIPFTVLLPIYVFISTQSYLVTGIFLSFGFLVTIAANFFTKDMQYSNKMVDLSVAAIVLSSLVFFIPSIIPAPYNAFIFAGIFTFAATPLNVRTRSNFFSLIDKDRKKADRAVFMINIEYYINAFRILISALLLLLLPYFEGIGGGIVLFPFFASYTLLFRETAKSKEPVTLKRE
jgi:MFS family permease